MIEAGSGAETLQMVDRYKPTLVLLDVNLPDMTGFEVCKTIRNTPAIASTTILHISASSVLTKHQVYGLDSGADGYIVEPIEPSILIATVNAFIRGPPRGRSSRKGCRRAPMVFLSSRPRSQRSAANDYRLRRAVEEETRRRERSSGAETSWTSSRPWRDPDEILHGRSSPLHPIGRTAKAR